MKKGKILVASVLMGLCSMGAFAQSNVVKINFFGLIASNYTLSYERVLNEKSALQLTAGVGNWDASWSVGGVTEGIWEYNRFIIVPEYRFYLSTASKDVPRGPYAAPFFRYSSITVDYTDNANLGFYNNTAKRSAVGGGVVIGWQWLLGDVVALDLWPIGLHYKSVSTSTTYTNQLASVDPNRPAEDDNSSSSGVAYRFGFSVGVAF